MGYDNKAEMVRLKKELAEPKKELAEPKKELTELRKEKARLRRQGLSCVVVKKKVRGRYKAIQRMRLRNKGVALRKDEIQREISLQKVARFASSHKRARSRVPRGSLSEIGQIAPKKKDKKEDQKD
jgi:hypothetical protein